MNLSNLKPGTKLMWDAPEPYDGYAKKVYNRNDNRIIYPAIISNRIPKVKELGKHVITGNGNGNFMGNESEYLRFPTKKELESLLWPNITI